MNQTATVINLEFEAIKKGIPYVRMYAVLEYMGEDIQHGGWSDRYEDEAYYIVKNNEMIVFVGNIYINESARLTDISHTTIDYLQEYGGMTEDQATVFLQQFIA